MKVKDLRDVMDPNADVIAVLCEVNEGLLVEGFASVDDVRAALHMAAAASKGGPGRVRFNHNNGGTDDDG